VKISKIWIGVLIATIVSFASIGLSTYSVARSIQTAPIMTSTSISLGQKFNWTVAEVVDVQGNLFAYLGYDIPFRYPTEWCSITLRLAKWQNGWMELSYSFFTYVSYSNEVSFYMEKVTLSPYILEIYAFNNNYLTATFLES